MSRYKAIAVASALAVLVFGTFVFNGGLTSFSNGLQAAATVLGDVQGAPPGYTGYQYPDQTDCWISYVYSDYGLGGGHGPLCRNNSAQPFYSGIFSINPTAELTAGESVYVNSTWIPAGFVQGPLLGPPFTTLGCPEGATMSVTSYDENGAATSGECYSGGRAGFGGGGTSVGPATYCYEDTSGGGGGRVMGGSGEGGTLPAKYSFPSGYSTTTGDKLDTVGDGGSPGSSFGDVRKGNGGDGQCYAWGLEPAHINSTLSPVGAIPSVEAGGELTLQWSCLPSRVVNGWGCNSEPSSWSNPWGTTCAESEYTNNVLNLSPLATGVSGSGPGFTSGTNLTDTKTVTAPSTKGIYNYSVTCAGPYNLPAMTIPVDVGGALVQPTVTITGNGQSGTVLADLGTTTVNIVGTFAPGEGDTLTRTALNGCTAPNVANPNQNCQNPLPGVNNTNAVTPKSYSFRPTQPGLYYFYPAMQTQLYFNWNNYGKRLVVDARCANGGTWVTGSADEDGIYGNNPNQNGGRCVATCPGGQTNPPACTTCGVGTHADNAGVCVPNTCSDPHAIPPLCSSCISGYEMKNGSCALIPPTLSLSAAQPTIRKGNPAKLSWSVTGLAADSGTECSISSSPAGVFSATMPDNTAPAWSGSNISTGSIEGTTFFTLSCTGAQSVSVRVNMIPVVIEI